MKLKLKLYPFHTFLFIPFIVLFLYAHNFSQTKAYMTTRTLWVGLTISTLLYGLFYVLFRNRLKTGVVVTFLLFAFFQYGVIYEFAESLYYKGLWPLQNIHRYLTLAYLVICSFFIWKTKRTGHDFIKINYFLNALVCLLLLFNLFRILSSGNTGDLLQSVDANDTEERVVFDPARPKPDIYFIILDGYASNPVLKKYFNFTNTEFTSALRQKGFRFCDSAFSNYYYTSASLAATLNYDYHDSTDSQTALIRNNRLYRTLKGNGYSICHIKSGYAVTSFFKLADKTILIDGPNEFEKSLFKYTILRLDDLIGLFAYKRLRSQFEKMNELIKPAGAPGFFFMHIVAPHPPYVFDRDGNMRTRHQFAEHSWEPKELYIDQMIYVNKQIQGFVDKLVRVNPNAIIVLQSDHGPWVSAATREEVFEARSQILCAYYTPKEIGLPLKTSPVNTFRYLMNGLFNCGLEILPDNHEGRETLMNDPILTKKAQAH